MQSSVSPKKVFFRSNMNLPEEQEMNFMDHLEVLRWHLMRSAAVLLSATILMFVFIDYIFDNIVYGPAKKDFISYTALCKLSHSLNMGDALCMPPINMQLMGNTVSGPFMSAISIAFTAGLIFSFPYIFYELWKFIKPALSKKEARTVTSSIGWVSLCFFAGASFGYFLLAPFTFNFLANFKLGTTSAYLYLPTLDDYITSLTSIILGCAIAFEMPVIVYVLSRVGVVNAAFLQKSRKFAYVIILILAAIITPSPDWMSQVIVTIPLIILYEISIVISKNVETKLAAQNN